MLTCKVTFVLGGAASGKSAYAEGLVEGIGNRKFYLATAQSHDSEMAQKIETHKVRRGAGWTTLEAPLDAARVLTSLPAGACVLFDCATMWLSNHMLAAHDLGAEEARLLAAIDTCPAQVVIVSNEVGQGIVPETPLGRQFREAQGRLNIALAARADRVIHVVAGLPRALKGEMP